MTRCVPEQHGRKSSCPLSSCGDILMLKQEQRNAKVCGWSASRSLMGAGAFSVNQKNWTMYLFTYGIFLASLCKVHMNGTLTMLVDKREEIACRTEMSVFCGVCIRNETLILSHLSLVRYFSMTATSGRTDTSNFLPQPETKEPPDTWSVSGSTSLAAKSREE